jgi:protein involved in polysaccharide export with SLBB domain
VQREKPNQFGKQFAAKIMFSRGSWVYNKYGRGYTTNGGVDMKRYLSLFFCMMTLSLYCQTTEIITTDRGEEVQYYFDDRSLRVISNPDYRVTPGDVYLLIYNSTQVSISQILIVDADYTVNLSIFGSMNVNDLTFLKFKRSIEDRVREAYPKSHPMLTIRSTGIFEVFIKGEVKEAGYRVAWGLTRLEEIMGDSLTPYSSIRNIQIISSEGKSTYYDMFYASRFGNKEQNPFVRPGDTIIVSQYYRQISIEGEIERPGIYQLLPNEQLKEVVLDYGNGFTRLADLTRLELSHYSTLEGIEEINYHDLSAGFKTRIYLSDGDTIFVPSKTELLPIVYFQGALVTENPNPQNEFVVHRLKRRIRKGESLYTALRSIELSPLANLTDCYIIRKKDKIFVDLDDYLYNYDSEKDIILQPMDRVVIPYATQPMR